MALPFAIESYPLEDIMNDNIRFWRLFADLLRRGKAILPALDWIHAVLPDVRLRAAVGQLRTCICSGGSFTAALREYPDLLPQEIARAIDRDEKGIDLSILALAIADVLESGDYARLKDLFPGCEFG